MSSDFITEMSTVYYCIRLADLSKMCKSLSNEFAQKGKDANARRLKKASKCFDDILTELTEDAKQIEMEV